MKNNCNLLRVTIFIFFVSVILIFIFFNYCSNDVTKLLLNISIGIFSSTTLALFLNISSYLTSKDHTLNECYNMYSKKLAEIFKIEYYNCDVNKKTMLGYIKEKSDNENHKKLGFKFSESHVYRDKLIDELYLIERDFSGGISEKQLKKQISSRLDRWFENEIQEINKVLKSYLKCSKIRIYDLNRVIGDIKFLLNDRNFNSINKDLHENLCKLLSNLRNFSKHISLYFCGKGNQYIVLEMLFDYQDNYLFSTVEIKKHNTIYRNVYFKLIDDMEILLEKLRARISNDKPKTDNPMPILTRVKVLKNRYFIK